MIENMLLGLSEIASFNIIGAVVVGVAIGIVFGSIPGLTATMAIAVLSPLTLTMEPLIAIPFLIGVYRGGLFGGVITSITLGVPGTPSNVPTLLDGYPLAKMGYPRTAMLSALAGSVTGAVFSSILLFTLIGPISSLALRVGQPEIFCLLLFSITLVSFLAGPKISKGWIAASLGLAIGLIGVDPITGVPRLTFGISELLGGIEIVPAVIGLFAVSELALQLEGHITRVRNPPAANTLGTDRASFRAKDDRITWRQVLRRYWRTVLTSSGIGAFIGVLPGIGSETSPWLSYTVAKRISRRRANFGRGEPEGVVAPEVSNDAVVGAAFIPLLIFGIPGDLPLAVMLGVFLANGLTPGPELFQQSPEVMFGIVATVLLSSFALYLVGRPMTGILSRIVKVPSWILFPSILILCIAGSFANANSSFDVVVMAIFGVVGYVLRKCSVPLAPLVLAFVLGPRLELSFRRSLLLDASPMTFLSSPLSIGLLIATIGLVVVVIRNSRRRPQESGTASVSEVE